MQGRLDEIMALSTRKTRKVENQLNPVFLQGGHTDEVGKSELI